MKNAFYLLAIALCFACQGEKKQPAQVMIPTPAGMQGLQKGNTTAAATPAVTTKSNLIFNPPHGEAGHTCALAVGAPLNPTARVQPQPNANPQPTPKPTTAVVNTSGKKLNPKHGEPGHRCDIAVGAPLDSKPTQVVTTTQPAVTQVSGVKVGKGLNPPHGQPNHRCDLAVGAPLNSKPAPIANPAPTPIPEAKTTETKVLETKSER
ncbi:hypothetical protein ACFSR6_16620 [Pedobacter vanadiisoli]|uniref:Uncharacterized protein n=1 Tax=Pedobacter vanadiisoli TaxID=1761975 RepID=A0ABW5MLV1_9SPHI